MTIGETKAKTGYQPKANTHSYQTLSASFQRINTQVGSSARNVQFQVLVNMLWKKKQPTSG